MPTTVVSPGEALDILAKARELLQQGSCRGNFATDDAGAVVDEFSSAASRWCLVGAVYAADYKLRLQKLSSESPREFRFAYLLSPAGRDVLHLLNEELPYADRDLSGKGYYIESLSVYHDSQESLQPTLDLIDAAEQKLRSTLNE